jgi:hypothetical protein
MKDSTHCDLRLEMVYDFCTKPESLLKTVTTLPSRTCLNTDKCDVEQIQLNCEDL